MFLSLIKTTKKWPNGDGPMVVRHYDEFHLWEKLLVLINTHTKRCSVCGWRTATWSYIPSWYYACDKCVPRGCTCNCQGHDKEPVDSLGDKYPCCEWMELD